MHTAIQTAPFLFNPRRIGCSLAANERSNRVRLLLRSSVCGTSGSTRANCTLLQVPVRQSAWITRLKLRAAGFAIHNAKLAIWIASRARSCFDLWLSPRHSGSGSPKLSAPYSLKRTSLALVNSRRSSRASLSNIAASLIPFGAVQRITSFANLTGTHSREVPRLSSGTIVNNLLALFRP